MWRFDDVVAMENEFGELIEAADVVVSDSAVHAERLVFPVVRCDVLPMSDLSEVVGYKAEYMLVKVDGTETLLEEGGDPSTVEPDGAYLKRLWDRAHE